MQLVGIRWKEFCETLAVAAYLFSMLFLTPISIITMTYLSYHYKIVLAAALVYLTWIWWDRKTNETGGRRIPWYRTSSWWVYHRSYFPVNLHKTVDLSPDRNYLLPVVPHGVLAAGAYSAFGTDANDFQKLFPGITSYLCTLKIMFFLPFVRELIILSGLVSPSEKSLDWILGSGEVGRSCALVVGGATEALHNEPGVYKTVLRHRKGFCRIALRNGCDLVPVVVFGEVDAYVVSIPDPGSWQEFFQKQGKALTGILPIRFIGDGFLGLLPKRVPINVVVGKPIKVTQKTDFTDEDISELHERFISCMVNLFEEEKHKYVKDLNTKLEFV